MGQSPYETYTKWEARTFCDNSSRRGKGVSLTPQCNDGKREFEVTVAYNDAESDTMTLCSECTKNLKADARRHHYKVTVKRLA
jgi:hypothetical protein